MGSHVPLPATIAAWGWETWAPAARLGSRPIVAMPWLPCGAGQGGSVCSHRADHVRPRHSMAPSVSPTVVVEQECSRLRFARWRDRVPASTCRRILSCPVVYGLRHP
jgi:hypothetical protein